MNKLLAALLATLVASVAFAQMQPKSAAPGTPSAPAPKGAPASVPAKAAPVNTPVATAPHATPSAPVKPGPVAGPSANKAPPKQ
jgi:hypothetical protein